MSDDLRTRREAVVLEHMRSENEQRFEDTLATFHPDSVCYEIVADDAVHDGVDAVREYYRRSRTLFPDQCNELIALHHGDDAVFVEFRLRRTHTGTLDDRPPTGRRFQARMLALFLFEPGGDRITCERVYHDRSRIARQLAGREPVGPD